MKHFPVLAANVSRETFLVRYYMASTMSADQANADNHARQRWITACLSSFGRFIALKIYQMILIGRW